MENQLEKEFKYYLENQAELVEKYCGKYIVIKDQSVVGTYETELEAVENTKDKFELGTFIVQKCLPGDDSYTQTYHSRVAFA